jgi:hypothetical protein
MLAYLPPLFFFAALMGSPVVGFLVFMLLGLATAWQRWRSPVTDQPFAWTREDTLLALCFISIPLFKALSVLWSAAPVLAWKNAFQHSYFLFWPLVLLGLQRCQSTQTQVDRALALGLIVAAAWRLSYHLTQWDWISPGNANVGILAQLVMVVGIWNLLALTRPGHITAMWRRVYAIAFFSTFTVLILSTRRLELMGFTLLSILTIAYRYRHHITLVRVLLFTVSATAAFAFLVYLRWDRFSVGLQEMADYLFSRPTDPDLVLGSWSIRAEFWRVGLLAFTEHPLLGLGASTQPGTLASLSPWGPQLIGHKHFHSHLVEVLVQGGLVGLALFWACLWHSTRKLIVEPYRKHPEWSLLAAGLLGAYIMEGSASAALHYDKANAMLVVASAWCWLRIRESNHRR